MLQFQNTYTPPAASDQMMNGRPARQTDWSTEISPAPAQMTQQRPRPASDTGIGGIAETPDRTQDTPGAMSGGMVSPGMQMYRDRDALDMTTGLPDEVIQAPTTVDETYKGSLKAMLSKNLGAFVSATFLLGTQGTVTWDGILYDVGNDFMTIYQLGRDRYIVSDIYSLKYIEFYDTRRRELCDQMLGGFSFQNYQPNRT